MYKRQEEISPLVQQVYGWEREAPGGAQGEPRPLMPVSYTHLDVYKRQVWGAVIEMVQAKEKTLLKQ